MKAVKHNALYLLLLLPLIYFAIFFHLDSLPFRMWDETYLGMHTYEMMANHNYVVTYSYGHPEMLNVKPPLVIWCMVGMSHLIGYGELSVRLPNAIAGAILCLAVFFLAAGRYRSPMVGFASAFCMLSSTGLIRMHVLRSGEYDALLLTFVFFYCICYFLLLEPEAIGRRKYYLWAGFTIAVICAIWAKGIAALLVMPALMLYTLFQKKIGWLLRSKEVYVSAALILFFGAGYYFLREHYNPGYLKAVYDNEIGGRYVRTNDGHEGPIYYYIMDLIETEGIWIPFFLIAVVSLFATKDSPYHRLIIFSTTVTIVFLLVISLGATKLEWYDAPIIPFFAINAGIGIYMVADFILAISKNPGPVRTIGGLVFICLLGVRGFADIISSNQSLEEPPWDRDTYNMCHYIKMKYEQNVDLNGYRVVVHQHHIVRQVSCELKKLEYKGEKLHIMPADSVQERDRVITESADDRNVIDQKFDHQVEDIYKNIEVWRLGQKKSGDNLSFPHE